MGLWFVGSAFTTMFLGTKSIEELIAGVIMIIFAALFMGFGFKLRRLSKKGVEDTKKLSR